MLLLILYWIKPKADDLWEVVIERARGPTQSQHQNFDKLLEIDIDLNTLLVEALHEANSDYVTIWQFHNGAVSNGGIPFQRISATHQQVRSGLTGWGYGYQNLPNSLFVACRAFRDMISVNVCATVCCDDTEGNETMLGILNTHNIKTMFVCPIRNTNGILVALITFSYLSDDKSHTSIRCDYAAKACVLLELQARLSKGG
jgi:hypothetical protein